MVAVVASFLCFNPQVFKLDIAGVAQLVERQPSKL